MVWKCTLHKRLFEHYISDNWLLVTSGPWWEADVGILPRQSLPPHYILHTSTPLSYPILPQYPTASPYTPHLTPISQHHNHRLTVNITPIFPFVNKKTSLEISTHPVSGDIISLLQKGLTLVQALRSRVGAKGCWRHFFKNPTTQLHVVWGLTEKKCEQTPKFACFSVQRRPLHEVGLQASCN